MLRVTRVGGEDGEWTRGTAARWRSVQASTDGAPPEALRWRRLAERLRLGGTDGSGGLDVRGDRGRRRRRERHCDAEPGEAATQGSSSRARWQQCIGRRLFIGRGAAPALGAHAEGPAVALPCRLGEAVASAQMGSASGVGQLG